MTAVLDTISEMIKRKVAVFGLDGITFDLLQPWLDQGRLPNLARLFNDGARGPLRSTIPPVSASAWPSFFTGVNPGRHGLIDFTYPAPDGYEIRVTNGRLRAAPALWEIVGQAGGRSGVVSMPMTYPPHPLNGFMLCSFLTPNQDAAYTYPPALKEELKSRAGPFPMQMSEKGRGDNPGLFVQSVKQMEIDRARTVNYLLLHKPWDLFLYVFETPDNLHHEVWHLLDANHPLHDAATAEKVLPQIIDYYETIDRLLGEMLEKVPDDALTVLLSDHGFGPFHKYFHVNNWLAANGWLKFKRTPATLLKRLAFKLGFTPLNGLKWVTRLRLSSLRQNVKRGRGGAALRRLFLSFHDVDWARTQAFSVGNFGQIYLNVQGKRPSGPIPPAAYEAVRDAIAARAERLQDPADGSPIIAAVYKREEIFHGGCVERLPDLVLHTDRARYVSFGHADFGSNRIVEASIGQTGHHHMVGILGLRGPGVRSGVTLPENSLLDLAPTILHYLGLPVPRAMDGRVLTDAFTDAFNQANPVQFSDAAPHTLLPNGALTTEEEALMIAKLRELGYVS